MDKDKLNKTIDSSTDKIDLCIDYKAYTILKPASPELVSFAKYCLVEDKKYKHDIYHMVYGIVEEFANKVKYRILENIPQYFLNENNEIFGCIDLRDVTRTFDEILKEYEQADNPKDTNRRNGKRDNR